MQPIPMRYQLERDIESANESSAAWLKQRLSEVLESDKDATRKCDYLGYSILGIDTKLHSIDEEIKELKAIKDKLKNAKDLALQVGAELFGEYGIAKLEGAGISSITVTSPLLHPKLFLLVTNPKPLMEAGFVKHILDEDAIKEAYESGQYKALIEEHCYISYETNETRKKLKINQRRSKASHEPRDTANIKEAA